MYRERPPKRPKFFSGQLQQSKLWLILVSPSQAESCVLSVFKSSFGMSTSLKNKTTTYIFLPSWPFLLHYVLRWCVCNFSMSVCLFFVTFNIWSQCVSMFHLLFFCVFLCFSLSLSLSHWLSPFSLQHLFSMFFLVDCKLGCVVEHERVGSIVWNNFYLEFWLQNVQFSQVD